MPPHPSLKIAVSVLFFGLIGAAWWKSQRVPAAEAPRPRESLGFAFTEIAHAAGVVFTHRPPKLDPKLDNIMPHVAGMGAAVSVSDVNRDGWPDFYATTSEFGYANALFLNQKDGTFRDVARAAGVADVNVAGRGASMGSVWGDYDGDGDEDLFLYKWGHPQLWRNNGDVTFTDVTADSGLGRWMNCNSAVWLDYDRDGRLDLYVAGYFRDDVDLWNLTTTRIMQASFEFAQNGGHNYMYRNAGDGRFEDVTAKLGVDSTRWTLAVAAADLNDDGWQDLYLANDYGPEELFLNREGQRFERMANVGLDESSKSGMSVSLGDFQNEGRLSVYVTNITKSPYLLQGNNLRVNRLADRGWLQNVADGPVADCGWSWGAQFGDFNNDGHMDLYVLNGFVSASKERDYWYGMGKVAGALGSLAEDSTNWPAMEDRSLSGYERSRVLVNRGRGRFFDAAESVGASDLFDGRSIALADLFNRGQVDVIVANQNGPLLIYKNEVDPRSHWIQFALVGRDNTSAIGSQVTVYHGGERTLQSIDGGSGFCSQNDRRLHFGLGPRGAVEKAVIRWSSGKEQVVAAPEVDRVHRIEEP